MMAAAQTALHYFHRPGQVTELRALARVDRNRLQVLSGYFDNIEKLAEAAICECYFAQGVYFVPNPIDPKLMARANNRIRPVYGDPTTSDADILRRWYLLIDLDPFRPSGISSTQSEHAAALQKAQEIRAWLGAAGWPTPIFVDSGNGAHLDYYIDLPVDDNGLVAGVLAGLAQRFDDAHVKVDVSVHNPARIWKLVGTYARKGDDIPDRPHRLASLIDAPISIVQVTEAQLRSVAGARTSTAGPRVNSARQFNQRSNHFDLEAWIAQHQLDVEPPRDWHGGRRWVFRVCPWNPAHTDRSAFIARRADGPISAGCHHNGCASQNWFTLRALFDRRPGPAFPTLPADIPANTHPAIQREIFNFLHSSKKVRKR